MEINDKAKNFWKQLKLLQLKARVFKLTKSMTEILMKVREYQEGHINI